MDEWSVTDITKQSKKDEADYGVTHIPPRRLVSMLVSMSLCAI